MYAHKTFEQVFKIHKYTKQVEHASTLSMQTSKLGSQECQLQATQTCQACQAHK